MGARYLAGGAGDPVSAILPSTGPLWISESKLLRDALLWQSIVRGTRMVIAVSI